MSKSLFVRSALAVAATLVMAGCDTEADRTLTAKDLALVSGACAKNGGFKQAERALPMWGPLEWRVDCIDGARFVLPA